MHFMLERVKYSWYISNIGQVQVRFVLHKNSSVSAGDRTAEAACPCFPTLCVRLLMNFCPPEVKKNLPRRLYPTGTTNLCKGVDHPPNLTKGMKTTPLESHCIPSPGTSTAKTELTYYWSWNVVWVRHGRSQWLSGLSSIPSSVTRDLG
jgi:hypothetical protein